MNDPTADFAMKGRVLSNCSCVGEKYEPGTEFHFGVYIPPVIPAAGAPVAIMLEYGTDTAWILEQLADEGVMPPCFGIFVFPGTLKPTVPGGTGRLMRPEEFDQNGREFSDFLVEELIPYAAALANVNVSASPDLHFITGGSSGGLCAWNAVWYRNDYFRRTFLSSPTFSAMRGGEEPMVLVRKTETRPIKIYLTVGTVEPDYFFGNSFYVACNAWKAFEYAGYDYRFELFDGKPHCYGRADPDVLRRVMAFVWADWTDQPVRPLRNQDRIDQICEFGTRWEETAEPFPEKNPPRTGNGTYTFADGTIYLEEVGGNRRAVASGFGKITAISLSSDRWRLYIADQTRRFVFAMSILPDGSLGQLYRHCPLHLAHDCRIVGATDLCTDREDRTYAATELGVQSVTSFGLNDIILPLPGDVPAERIAFGGPLRNVMYAQSGGKTWKRAWKIGAADMDVATPPAHLGYSDGVDYSIAHKPQ